MPFAKVWNKDRVLREASKCGSMSDFQRKFSGGYKYAARKGLIELIRESFPHYSDATRSVYLISFASGHEYVGLSLDVSRRLAKHKEGRFSYLFLGGYSLALLHKGLTAKDAVFKEAQEILKSKERVKDKNLNINTGGSLGATRKHWTKAKVEKVAESYSTITKFRAENEGAYDSAYRGGFLKDVTSHMVDGAIKWNEKTIAEEMSKYSSRYQFQKGNNSAYNAARRLKIWEKYAGIFYSKSL